MLLEMGPMPIMLSPLVAKTGVESHNDIANAKHEVRKESFFMFLVFKIMNLK